MHARLQVCYDHSLMEISEEDNQSLPSTAFDLHGLVTIRLVNAQPRDVQAVSRQLGPIRCKDRNDADITIRFVDRVAPSSRVRYLGLHQGGFTDDAFLVLRASHKARTRVQIPMAEIGGKCALVCEHGIPAIPLLTAIVNLTALTKGSVPLHAAAFEWKGAGVVVTGWSKGGKTETLLSFMNRGARYIADEWCYIAPDGRRIFGVPEPVRLWRWQLLQLPHYRRRISLMERINMATLSVVPTIQASLPLEWQRSRPGRATQRVAHFLEQQLHVNVAPEKLFDQGIADTEGQFTHLVFVLSTEDPATTVEPAAPQVVAERMVHSLAYERLPLLEYYRMFRFAFPELANPHLEAAEQREQTLLGRAFEGKPTVQVTHPYPVQLDRLFECIEPLLH